MSVHHLVLHADVPGFQCTSLAILLMRVDQLYLLMHLVNCMFYYCRLCCVPWQQCPLLILQVVFQVLQVVLDRWRMYAWEGDCGCGCILSGHCECGGGQLFLITSHMKRLCHLFIPLYTLLIYVPVPFQYIVYYTTILSTYTYTAMHNLYAQQSVDSN